ncbi:hypothetical protein [Catenulispora subtropica]|uniref:Amidohydrolase n=1 Tax=Catenulispora subtropica TaxID=450798 RepID=A0ABP5DRA8_9ACTN
MQLRRTTAAVTLVVTAFGTALLATGPAQAGTKVPQVPQGGIAQASAAFPPGPTVVSAGVIIPQMRRDTIVLEDATSYPPGPTVVGAGVIIDDGSAFPPGPTVVGAGVIIHDGSAFPPGPSRADAVLTA